MESNVKEEYIEKYLNDCKCKNRLSDKTLKAYKQDLDQFYKMTFKSVVSKKELEEYIYYLNEKYSKPKTVKRKIASIKAYFNYLEYEEIIEINPFRKLRIQYKEPKVLPKTIPNNVLNGIFKQVYIELERAKTPPKRKLALRNVAIIELLYSTGMRISELCNLKANDINLEDKYIIIYGKGAKERVLALENELVIKAINAYCESYQNEIQKSGCLFIGRNDSCISEQTVRNMIQKYANKVSSIHITPHMFRHTFATKLLEENVDIRYIQQILGHSSIAITQIYTHVSSSKQREIFKSKNPRNFIKI